MINRITIGHHNAWPAARTLGWGVLVVSGAVAIAILIVLAMAHSDQNEVLLESLSDCGGKFQKFVSISSDGRLLATCSSSTGAIVFLDVATGREVREIAGMDSHNRRSGSFGKTHFIRYGAGTMDLWDTRVWKQLERECPERTSCVVPTHHDRLVFLGTYGAGLQLLDVRTGRLEVMCPRSEPVWAVDVSLDETWLASSRDETIVIWDVAKRMEIAKVKLNKSISHLRFSRSHSLLCASSDDGLITTIDTRTWLVLKTFRVSHPQLGIISGLRFVGNTPIIVTASTDRFIQFFDCRSGLCICRFNPKEPRPAYVESFDVDSKGDILAVLFANRNLKCWRIPRLAVE